MAAARTIDWAVSVENPEQQIGEPVVTLPDCCRDDIEAQYNTGNEALSVPNLMPDFVTRVAINPATALHVDVGGVLARVPPHASRRTTTVKERRGRRQRQRAGESPPRRPGSSRQAAYGAGLGRYVGGLVPDVAFRADGSIRAVPVTSWVSGDRTGALATRVRRRLLLGLARPTTTTSSTSTAAPIGFGYPGSSNAVNRSISRDHRHGVVPGRPDGEPRLGAGGRADLVAAARALVRRQRTGLGQRVPLLRADALQPALDRDQYRIIRSQIDQHITRSGDQQIRDSEFAGTLLA